jgi:hypothetical protein
MLQMYLDRINMTDNDAMCGLYHAWGQDTLVSVTKVRGSESMFNVLYSNPNVSYPFPHETMDKRSVWEKFAQGKWVHYGTRVKVEVR